MLCFEDRYADAASVRVASAAISSPARGHQPVCTGHKAEQSYCSPMCPDRDRPGSSQGHPCVSGSHGNVASLSHHNLQVSPEGSRAANDRMETVHV